MSEEIKFIKNGSIKLPLLKDEIDRRFALLLGKLMENSPEQIRVPPETKDEGINVKVDQNIDNVNVSDNESNNSQSKHKIQNSQNRCFENLSSISQDIMNQFSFSLHAEEDKAKISGKNTARSNLINKQNKGESNVQKNYKVRTTSRRTPLSNRINHSRSKSGLKKFSLDKPPMEMRQTITEQIVQQLKAEIQEQVNKSRRELADDNVRTNLLKRIQAMATPRNLENQLI